MSTTLVHDLPAVARADTKPPTVALAGGGTGGHVYPALAIGDVLRQRGVRVLYYGSSHHLEARVAPQRGYLFRPVSAMQYPRRGLWGKVRFAAALLRSIVATRAALKRDGVDLVLGVGGFISAPPVLAAWTLGRPSVIHEANVAPGLANRLCARVASTMMVAWERTLGSLNGGGAREVVGMPVNPAVLRGDRAEACVRYGLDPARPVVLFVGGSLGAARINELAMGCARSERDWQVLHLCGPRFEDEVREALGVLPAGVAVVGYEDLYPLLAQILTDGPQGGARDR